MLKVGSIPGPPKRNDYKADALTIRLWLLYYISFKLFLIELWERNSIIKGAKSNFHVQYSPKILQSFFLFNNKKVK